MYQKYNSHPYPYGYGVYGAYGHNGFCGMQPCPYWVNAVGYGANYPVNSLQTGNAAAPSRLRDYGPQPIALNIDEAASQNTAFRSAVWTGEHLQVTLMSLNPGEDIGLEMHPDVDQFLRIEDGRGRVQMGDNENNLDYEENVSEDYAIMIPAGSWHNLINIGNTPLKLYSIYAPPEHPRETVHETKQDSIDAEEGSSSGRNIDSTSGNISRRNNSGRFSNR